MQENQSTDLVQAQPCMGESAHYVPDRKPLLRERGEASNRGSGFRTSSVQFLVRGG